jgi:carboxyl-terminal processing protease
VKSVRSHPEGTDVGYIRVTQFNEQTTDGLKQAISDLNSQLGADKIRGHILDLRNNPGGLFDQASQESRRLCDVSCDPPRLVGVFRLDPLLAAARSAKNRP